MQCNPLYHVLTTFLLIDILLKIHNIYLINNILKLKMRDNLLIYKFVGKNFVYLNYYDHYTLFNYLINGEMYGNFILNRNFLRQKTLRLVMLSYILFSKPY